jgi:hypothetical protein
MNLYLYFVLTGKGFEISTIKICQQSEQKDEPSLQVPEALLETRGRLIHFVLQREYIHLIWMYLCDDTTCFYSKILTSVFRLCRNTAQAAGKT